MTGRKTVGAVLAVLAISAVACGGGRTALRSAHRPSREKPSPRAPEVAVDTAATPVGWVPVDYGDSQLSVPADWYVTLGSCVTPNARGTIILQPPDRAVTPPSQPSPSCMPTDTSAAGSPVVKVGPITTTVPAAGPTPLVINGIVVDLAGETACATARPCSTWYVVPSLGIEIVDDEIPGERPMVIDTLTHAPRAVVLAAALPSHLFRWGGASSHSGESALPSPPPGRYKPPRTGPVAVDSNLSWPRPV